MRGSVLLPVRNEIAWTAWWFKTFNTLRDATGKVTGVSEQQSSIIFRVGTPKIERCFRLSTRCKWYLRSSGMLRRVEWQLLWWLVALVSVLPKDVTKHSNQLPVYSAWHPRRAKVSFTRRRTLKISQWTDLCGQCSEICGARFIPIVIEKVSTNQFINWVL